ncbi:hypothetical protein GALL_531020 [mine drainage metagenome]|uniref:Uncharacterized protein n=1 Tax=mine drainage metagenome TaxID=410659 RepID=A0A1J5P2J5_9ZZZZ
MDDTIPSHYRGVWRRTLLTATGVRDDSTLVLWMQTARWHADLRIPEDRPDCSGCHSLADCSRAQLLGLLRQEGFAGITTVDGAICEWHRRLDYRPTGRRDLGSMAFSPAFDAIDEVGVESDYAERWEREPQGSGAQGMAFTPDDQAPGLWLFFGPCFMRVRARRCTPMRRASPGSACRTGLPTTKSCASWPILKSRSGRSHRTRAKSCTQRCPGWKGCDSGSPFRLSPRSAQSRAGGRCVPMAA